ncbi:MAG: polysaccharide export protein [Gammaproteobacteria bacterium]
MTNTARSVLLLIAAALVAACAATPSEPPELPPSAVSANDDYIIAPGSVLQVFVWQNPDLSVDVPVRPDGRISTPLVEDMEAAGKTPTQLARDMEEVLATYIRQPRVNIIVSSAEVSYEQQIRVVGQAANPQALEYRDGMTLLDVMIAVGGLGQYAAGNRAKLVRQTAEGPIDVPVRLDDLLNAGEISQNVAIQPGDVIIIPEARF